ncbi:MAG TPA: 2-polyprenyl-3-methyl-6-methoxy-1,4-benzoquinone monooxygenase [Gammaproteobacteria bacterium]|jgi:ubiquinone biosynthesis monooxygenase Coq7|nr:2-polyprenyl-3-methyl-6-methoxy-1,4-benzoquinone monooxygenase [Gammaproteobacteria bacterium]
MTTRRLTPFDRVLSELEHALRTSTGGGVRAAARPNPAAKLPLADELDEAQRQEAARLMRVNHAGEIAAQALYQGQAFMARDPKVQAAMAKSSDEEVDHLAWCEQRLKELDGPVSKLDPFWYAGSFALGALAGLAGDAVSLGFLGETERQVVRHLDGHLKRLPEQDRRSRAILEQMRDDEARHGTAAERAGGTPLPAPVCACMQLMSKVMTTTAYWI